MNWRVWVEIFSWEKKEEKKKRGEIKVSVTVYRGLLRAKTNGSKSVQRAEGDTVAYEVLIDFPRNDRLSDRPRPPSLLVSFPRNDLWAASRPCESTGSRGALCSPPPLSYERGEEERHRLSRYSPRPLGRFIESDGATEERIEFRFLTVIVAIEHLTAIYIPRLPRSIKSRFFPLENRTDRSSEYVTFNGYLLFVTSMRRGEDISQKLDSKFSGNFGNLIITR